MSTTQQPQQRLTTTTTKTQSQQPQQRPTITQTTLIAPPQRTSVLTQPPRAITTQPRASLITPAPAPITRLSTRISQAAQRPSQVIGIRQGAQRFVEERFVGERVVGVTENRLEARVVSTAVPQLNRTVKQIETFEEEPVIKEKIIEKPIEVVKEKKSELRNSLMFLTMLSSKDRLKKLSRRKSTLKE